MYSLEKATARAVTAHAVYCLSLFVFLEYKLEILRYWYCKY